MNTSTRYRMKISLRKRPIGKDSVFFTVILSQLISLTPPPPRLKGVSRQANVALLDAINSSGDVFLIHTELAGQYTIRWGST